jgi:beta-alanine--pyruvate transaminase
MNTRDDRAMHDLHQSLNLEPLWLPFTPNRQFKAAPRLLTGAKDMHYTTSDGRRVLDGIAGLWCVNAGHCREPIVAAIQKQAATLDYATAFNMSHAGAFQAADSLVRIAPKGLDHVSPTRVRKAWTAR